MMKKTLLILALLAMTGIASANLLTNGDFTLGENDPADQTQPNELNPANWTEWTSGGWTNRETNANGTYGDDTNFHMALGNAGGYGAGVFQEIATTAGTSYELSADAALDTWWKNSGYLKLEFIDATGAEVGFAESAHFSQAGYDTGLAWAKYYLNGTAPDGAVTVRAILGTYGEGGTARFDNASLIVPEPATMLLLGLGGLVLRRKK